MRNRIIGGRQPFFLIAGPCVIEDRDCLMTTCEALIELCKKLDILFIFKSSFDKANRTSIAGKRGSGLEQGLRELSHIKKTFDVPLLTDIHECSQVKAVAEVVDIIQIPAFLCRQTDLIISAAKTGKWVNVKKGQFLSPWDVPFIIEKIKSIGSEKYLITERGTTFGYNNLVFDPRSPEIMHKHNIPVIFDGTHSTQLPGGGRESGGEREFTPVLMRAAVAAGIEGLFMEIHPNPVNAWSDAKTQYALKDALPLIENLYHLDRFIKKDQLSSGNSGKNQYENVEC